MSERVSALGCAREHICDGPRSTAGGRGLPASLWGLALIAGLAAHGAGCSDDSSSKSYSSSELTIETKLSQTLVAPGTAVDVTCTVTHFSDGVVNEPTLVKVFPATGARVEGNRVVADAVGIYNVACALALEPEAADKTPELLRVTPGGAARVETQVSPSEIPAGGSADVTCAAFDASGASVNVAFGVKVTPEETVEATPTSVSATRAGEYGVRCVLADLPDVGDDSPAPLTVTAGEAAKTRAVLDASTYAAGDVTTAVCEVFDAWDNPVETTDATVVVDPVDGVKVQQYTLTMLAVGSYEARCEHAGVPESAQTPAKFSVEAGEAAAIAIVVTPDQPAYKPGDEVEISWSVVDAYQNPVGDQLGTLTPPASGVTSLGDNSFTLDAEGTATFTVTVDGAEPLSASRDLLVDGTPPLLIITSPARGSTFDGNGTIEVVGKATDPVSAVKVVEVNGKAITTTPDGSFAIDIDSVHGLNLVVATAADGAGNVAETSVAWYYSTGFQPYEGTTVADVVQPGALQVFLGQDVLDDGVHDFTKVDDIATLIELVLAQADLTALAGAVLEPIVIPGIINTTLFSIQIPLINQNADFTLTGDLVIWPEITEFAVSPQPSITLDTREGGIDVSGKFEPAPGFPGLALGVGLAIELPISLTGSIAGNPIVTATINPSISSVTYATIESFEFFTGYEVEKESGQPLLIFSSDLQLALDGLELTPFQNAMIDLGAVKIPQFGVTVDLPEVPLDNLIGPIGEIIGDVAAPITEFILDFAGPVLAPLLGDVAATVLTGVLESLELEQAIPVPGFLGGDGGELVLRAGLDTVQFTEAGGFVALEAGAWSEKVTEAAPLGSVLRQACLGLEPGEFAFTGQNPMGVALGLDLLNEILFAAWWNGLLDIQADGPALSELSPEIAEFGVKALSLAPKLPPMLTDCNGKSLLRLQLGDALLGLEVDFLGLVIDADFYASLEADVAIIAQGQELAIKVNGITLMHFDAVAVNDAWKGKESELEALLASLLQSQLEDLLSDALGSFPIPSLDLSGLVPGVPEGTVLQVGGTSSDKLKGYISIEGDLQ